MRVRNQRAGTFGEGVYVSDTYRKDPEAVSRLTPEQYRVTQKAGTEPAFRNEYWDNKEPGIYVDVVSGAVSYTHLTLPTIYSV